MYVHEETGLCFLAAARTASRAVAEALKDQLGFVMYGEHHDGPEQGYDMKGFTPFSTVRNHWDTVISFWYNVRMHQKQAIPSLGWLASYFSKNRGYFWPGRMFKFREVEGITLLRYEHLERDLNHILGVQDLGPVELPKVGVSEEREGRHYSRFYDHDTRHFVQWCFLPEITALGYQFIEDPLWLPEEPGTLSFMFAGDPDTKMVSPGLKVPHGPAEMGLDAVIVVPPDEEEGTPS